MGPHLVAMLFTASLSLGVYRSAAARASQLVQGARVRYELAGSPGIWQTGRLISLGRDTVMLDRDGTRVVFDLSDIVTLEMRRRNGRGALIGAGIGALVAPAVVASFADAAGSSDLAGIALVGALTGATWGGGKRSRTLGAWGFLAGAAAGALAFGPTNSACEGGAPDYCGFVIGAAFGGGIGLVVGSVIGLFLPNWVHISLDLRGR